MLGSESLVLLLKSLGIFPRPSQMIPFAGKGRLEFVVVALDLLDASLSEQTGLGLLPRCDTELMVLRPKTIAFPIRLLLAPL